MKKRERRLNKIVGQISEGIFIIDPSTGALLELNASASDSIGLNKDDIAGLKYFDINTDLAKEKEWGDFRDEIKKNISVTIEGGHKRRDETNFPVEITAKYLTDEAGDYILALVSDITERKKAEEQIKLSQRQVVQADKMKSLGILVAGVAHEINNPNSFIMINAPLLKRVWDQALPVLEKYHASDGDFSLGGMPFESVKEAVPKLLVGINDGADRIKRIVDKLKDFARYDTVTPRSLASVNDIVKSASTLVESLINKSTHNFRIKYQNDLPPIWCNFYEIEQVVINLITNACQALPDSNHTVYVETAKDIAQGNVLIKVTDDGVGIAADEIKRITDPFFSTKRESGGTGLGLSVSYNIIGEHNGIMEFDSTKGKGTTATIRLPIDQRKKHNEE